MTEPLSGPFRVRVNNLEIQHDEDYGMDHRSGWSVVWDGSFFAELEPTLLEALEKAVPRIRAAIEETGRQYP